jgi:hypothetical protein
LRLYVADASSKLDISDRQFTLSGLSDLRFQLNQSLADDRVLASVGVNVPSGKKKLSHAEERPVAMYLAQNYLSVPIRRLSDGPGFNFLLGGATTAGNARYGGSVVFQYNGAYEAYEEDGDYNPGDLFSAAGNVGLQRDQVSLGFDVIFSMFGTDQLNDRNIFKQGKQLDLRASGSYDAEEYVINGAMRYLIRGRATRYDYDSTGAIYDQLKLYGNEFAVDGQVTWTRERWRLTPLVEMRLIAGNEYGFESSHTICGGIECAYAFNRETESTFGIKYFTGGADGGAIDLSGYQLFAGVSAAF